MEGICDHCYKVKEIEQVGFWCLCQEHKDLKQYQEKKKKKHTLKRTPIKKDPSYRIHSITKKQSKAISEYRILAKKYKKDNPFCSVQRPECTYKTEDIHHSKGKVGYADQWARDNEITLLVDVRHFVPACRFCHDYIELNPKWAYENGFSKSRL